MSSPQYFPNVLLGITHVQSVFKMERGLAPNKLVPRLRGAVDEYRELLPVIQALRNKALKERHWTKIFEVVGTTFTRDANFTLQVLCGAVGVFGLRRKCPR